MPRSTSRGKCSLCGKDLSQRSNDHVRARGIVPTERLLEQSQRSDAARERKSRGDNHQEVEGYRLAEYWMHHLKRRSAKRLEDLDHLLRQTWLECLRPLE